MVSIPLLPPAELLARHWPHVRLYREQWQIVRSVVENTETVVVAGHQLGKDFITGFVCLWYFLSAVKYNQTCRIVTTSVKDDHLRVLWGELSRYLEESVLPLDARNGGPLVLKHRDIRMARECMGGKEGYSYLRGMVSEKGEGMAGHHAGMTLLVVDEASGVDQIVYERGVTWAKRCLIIGNPYNCQGGENHFFQGAVARGDIEAPVGK